MSSTSTTHLSPEREQLIRGIFAAIDRTDADGLLTFLSPDASQRFGNQEPLVGAEQIRQGNVDFFGSIQGLSHDIVDAWESEETVAVRLDVTYTRLDGNVVTLPAMTVVHLGKDGLIDTYEVLADMAPIFAPAA